MTLEWMSFTVLHTYYLAIVYFRNVADKNNDKWLILVMLEGEESRQGGVTTHSFPFLRAPNALTKNSFTH